MSLDNIVLHQRSQMKGTNSVRTKDTYVLTEVGWRPLFTVEVGDHIFSYTEEGNLDLDQVVGVVNTEEPLVNYNHSFWGFEVGKSHTWLGYRRMTLTDNKRVHIWDRRGYGKLSCEFHILNSPSNYYNNKVNLITPDECSLLGWLLSDGCISWSKDTKRTSSSNGKRRGVVAGVTQNDNKHGAEIKELMLRLGGFSAAYIKPNTPNICRHYTLKSDWFREYWEHLGFQQQGKFSINLVKFLLEQPTENVEAFMEAFQKADGHYSRQGKKVLTQNESNLSEGIFTAAYLLGYNPSSGSKGYYQNSTGKINKCMWYKLQTKPHQTAMRLLSEEGSRGLCTTLKLKKSTCFVARQNDFITLI